MSVATSTELAIETAGLTKQFGCKLAVDNLSLHIPRGCTYGLLGPNGAGKSTTIRMLIGTLTPTAGEARLLGLNVCDNAMLVKQRVGYVPETQFIYRWMRVREAIGFCRAFYPTWNDQLCAELRERFALDPEQKVKQLSKGMLTKLALLLAVAHEPELLLLDEPLSGLDPLAREEFLDGVLRTICDQGQTVLLSSHMLDDVHRLADTVGILYEGQLLIQGDLDNLLSATKRICATLRDGARPAQTPAGTIWQQINGREWSITVCDFTPEKFAQVRAYNEVEQATVVDLGLEELFKDFVKGRRVAK